jgi:hypothetical protein
MRAWSGLVANASAARWQNRGDRLSGSRATVDRAARAVDILEW